MLVHPEFGGSLDEIQGQCQSSEEGTKKISEKCARLEWVFRKCHRKMKIAEKIVL